MADYTVGQLMQIKAVLDKHCQKEVSPAFAALLRRVRRIVREHILEFQEELDKLIVEHGEKVPGQGYVIRVNSPGFPEFERRAAEIRGVTLAVELRPELRLSQFPGISGDEIDILDPVLILDTQESAE